MAWCRYENIASIGIDAIDTSGHIDGGGNWEGASGNMVQGKVEILTY